MNCKVWSRKEYNTENQNQYIAELIYSYDQLEIIFLTGTYF